jgi:hypothetical protein
MLAYLIPPSQKSEGMPTGSAQSHTSYAHSPTTSPPHGCVPQTAGSPPVDVSTAPLVSDDSVELGGVTEVAPSLPSAPLDVPDASDGPEVPDDSSPALGGSAAHAPTRRRTIDRPLRMQLAMPHLARSIAEADAGDDLMLA